MVHGCKDARCKMHRWKTEAIANKKIDLPLTTNKSYPRRQCRDVNPSSALPKVDGRADLRIFVSCRWKVGNRDQWELIVIHLSGIPCHLVFRFICPERRITRALNYAELCYHDMTAWWSREENFKRMSAFEAFEDQVPNLVSETRTQ